MWLLINPPNKRRVTRDCYCSDIVKARYYWHPMDLLIQASLLSPHTEVVLLDAVASGMDRNQCKQILERVNPDGVLTLVGNVVLEDDLAFCRWLRKILPSATIIGSGDIFQEDAVLALNAFDPLDGVLLDFTSGELARMVCGETPEHDMVLKPKGSPVQLPLSDTDAFSYPPVPEGLFDARRYSLPFYGGSPFYSLLTSYGCPFRCRFCHVPSLGYKARPAEEVIEEIGIGMRQGFKYFYLRDATFGVSKSQAVDLCEKIASHCPGIRWNCFTRADLLDEELLEAMARSGCAVIQMGAETLDPRALRSVEKPYDTGILERVVGQCRRRGILTSLHFVLGLPEDRWVNSRGAFKNILDLNPDYISLNVLAPRPGSAFKRKGVRVSPEDLARHRRTVKKWNRRFYLRPRRIASELSRMGNAGNLFCFISLAKSLFTP